MTNTSLTNKKHKSRLLHGYYYVYYNVEKKLSGDLFISVDRVKDNASVFNENFNLELFRVIIHGVLHLCGFNDKTTSEQREMRQRKSLFKLNN